ncbi:MAG: hypothetical protein UY10_C0005G0019 [Microgenomates group bacterium GW2011_GWA2_47_8]|nr:MAG: hypothetical protein UY10_C0005G0019 [Microgenomates group bacterium GW2011_GWA2_47_8]
MFSASLRRRLPLVFVLIGIGITTFFIARTLIPRAAVLWDEAVFLLWSYKIYEAIRAFNLASLGQIAYGQVEYPPLQSLLLGIPLSFIGFSIEKARLVGLGWFIAAGILVYILACRVAGKHKSTTGLLATFLFLTSPLILYHASVAMKEMMGAALSLFTILLYITATKRNRPIFYMLTSIGLVALFLTKYHYSAFIGIGILIEFCISLLLVKHKSASLRGHALIFVPLLVVILLWIYIPVDRSAKIMEIIANKTLSYTGDMVDPMTYVLFYPRSVVYFYAISPAVGILLITAIGMTIKNLKNSSIRLLWIVVIVNMILVGTHVENIQDRYIFTTMPFLFILAALGITETVDRLLRIQKPRVRVAFALAAILFLYHLSVHLVRLPSQVYGASAQSLHGLTFDQTDYTDHWFFYDTSRWPKKLPGPNDERARDVLDFIVRNVEATKPIQVAGVANAFSPDYVNLKFALTREHTSSEILYPSYVVTVEVLPSSRHNNLDFQKMVAWHISEIRAIERDPTLIRMSGKLFNELGVYVTIYTKKS